MWETVADRVCERTSAQAGAVQRGERFCPVDPSQARVRIAVEQVIRRLALRPRETYFWATHSGTELDLLVIRSRHRLGFELKRTDSELRQENGAVSETAPQWRHRR